MNGKRSSFAARLIVPAAAVLFGCAGANAQVPADQGAAPSSPSSAAASAPPQAVVSPPAVSPSPNAAQGPAGVAQQVAPQPGAIPVPPTTSGQQAHSEPLPDACFASPAKLSDADIEAFLAKPEQILTQYGGGGIALSNRVRTLAGSDKRTLDPLLRLAAAAKPDEKAMIGAGLGRAAFACSRTAPAYAAMIQSMIAGASSPELLTAFLSATNDIQTAATGAGGNGGGAAGGGLSGGGLAGPFSAGLGGDEVVPTTAQTYSSAGRSVVLNDDDDDDDDGDSGDGNPGAGGGDPVPGDGDPVSPANSD